MEYTQLAEETKKSLYDATISQIEQEHFSHSLALKRAQAIEDESQINTISKVIADLEKQHEALVAEVLPAPAVDGA